jgi:mitochondrial-processing peptidase subunit beta
LGLTILGSDDNIKGLQRQDVLNYINTHYTADRMVLVGAGGVDHDELCRLGEQAFGSLKKSSYPFKMQPSEFTGSEIRIRDDSMRDAHIAVAVEGVGWDHPDFFPLLVAQTIVGSWDKSLGNGSHMSSKVAQEISSKNLANSFSSFSTTYTDTGLFGLYMIAPDRMKLTDLCEVALNNWRNSTMYANDNDVFRAKNQLKTSLLFSLDSSVQVAEEIGRHMLTYGRRLSPFEVDRMIDGVDAKTVRDVALKYIYDVDPAVVAVGPIEAWPDYVALKRSMVDYLF